MAFKFIAVLAIASLASGVEYQQHGEHQYYDQHNDYHHEPQYQSGPVQYSNAPVVKSVAAPIYHAAPAVVKTVAAAPVYKHVEYEDAPAKYDFSYEVHDEHTGDIKSQHEVRDGHNVHGSYSLLDADGYYRTVEYTADEHNGFNAVVRREPSNHKVVAPVAKIATAPVAHYSQPQYVQSPVAKYVAAPVAKVVKTAPVAKFVAAPNAHYDQQPHYAQSPVYHAEPIAAAHYATPVAKVLSPTIAKVAQYPHSAPNNYHY